MAGRIRLIEMREGSGSRISVFEIPDYAPRAEDRAWVDRELGDAGNEPIPFELTEAGKEALK
ncbi:hypothetical protein SAMN05216569_1087 [Pseudoxanthomonas sp. CF125]|nr:hypothetical protein SAMN05216569_1087 [Pseudoxanthomonas sp. CF125]